MKIPKIFTRNNLSKIRLFTAIVFGCLAIAMGVFILSICVLVFLFTPDPYPYKVPPGVVGEELIDDGWKRLITRDFEILAPASYEISDTNQNMEIMKSNSQLLAKEWRSIVKWHDVLKPTIALWAKDVDIGHSEYTTNFLVGREQVIPGVDVKRYIDVAPRIHPKQTRILDRSFVDIDNRRAGRLYAESTIGAVTSSQLIYVLKVDNTIWFLVFSTAGEEYDARYHTFERSASSFRILRLASARSDQGK